MRKIRKYNQQGPRRSQKGVGKAGVNQPGKLGLALEWKRPFEMSILLCGDWGVPSAS